YLAYGTHADEVLPRIDGTHYFYRDDWELVEERETFEELTLRNTCPSRATTSCSTSRRISASAQTLPSAIRSASPRCARATSHGKRRCRSIRTRRIPFRPRRPTSSHPPARGWPGPADPEKLALRQQLAVY